MHGTWQPGFGDVQRAFERNFVEHGEVGASVCVTVNGETVVDLWGGTVARRADEATNEPTPAWDADTLEWAVASPPPNHGFSVPPIVHSRHPLWDQSDLHDGDPRLVSFVHGLAEWPLTWRAALVTSVNDA